ncbi:MAG: hypothetical protein H0W53_20245 [Acidobacteria bacterium]|nr:hypothetical protein [Acidobacteriota bacterium]
MVTSDRAAIDPVCSLVRRLASEPDAIDDVPVAAHGECGDPECDCTQPGSPADCRHHA